MNEACLLDLDNGPPQARGDAYLNYIATYVDMLIANGITPILDLHWTVGKASDTSTTDQVSLIRVSELLVLLADAGRAPQQDFANVGHSLDFWKRVAKRFVNYGNVVFELFNEPKPKASVKMWWCLQYGWNPKFCDYNPGYQVAGMQDMINVVRSMKFKGLLLCAGLDFANDIRDWAKYKLKDDKENNLAISVHVYVSRSSPLSTLTSFSERSLTIMSPRPPHSYQDFKEICKGVECIKDILVPIARFHPIVTTELGSSSTNPTYLYNFMYDFMKQAYEANIGTIGWSLNHRRPGDPQLLDNTQGKPSPAGYGLIDFIKYARGLKVTSTYRGGSHRALTAPVSSPLNKGLNNVEELQQ